MADVDLIAESLVALAQPRSVLRERERADERDAAVSIPILKAPQGNVKHHHHDPERDDDDDDGGEDDELLERNCSPNGVVDLFTLMIQDHQQNRVRGNSLSSIDSDLGDITNLNLKDVKYIGTYSPNARKRRIDRFLEKRKRRVWAKKVDYGVRKNFADSRLRVKGRFVKKEDEELLVKLMAFT